MKSIKEVYSKKELHEFVDSIDWTELKRWQDHQKHIAEFPNSKSIDPKTGAHRQITGGNIKSKYTIAVQFGITTEDKSRNAHLQDFMLKYGLDQKDEYQKHKLTVNRPNTGKYMNQLNTALNKKLPNLSPNKIVELEAKVIKHLAERKQNYYCTREDIAMLFEVKLKYIDQIFQKLMKLGIMQKNSGQTTDAWHDRAWHATFYNYDFEKIKQLNN